MASSSTLRILDPTPVGSSRIGRLAAKYKAISEELKQLEARKRDIAEKFLVAMKAEAEADAEGKLRLETDDYRLVVVKGQSGARIDPQLLLKNGVSVKVIKKSTVAGKEYEYVKVSDRKAEVEGDKDDEPRRAS